MTFPRLRLWLVCALVFMGAPALAQRLPQGMVAGASVEGIDEYRLRNGLQVLLVPDESKPSTTVNLTYRVGSRHENYGETGMAHLLEHMLFKGTPKHKAVWADFEKRGLAANGSTSFDRTNYTATFSYNADNLQWYLGWLGDAMVNSFIARKDLDSEMTVVRNEMESGENSPDRVLTQKTLSVMFDWHHYANSPIGARSDVENVDIPRLQAFYRTYYQPDNATLIVSGRFDAAKVLAWVDASFGKLARPTRKLPALYTLDPAQDGERSVTVRRVGGVPMLMAAYHMPPGGSPDFAAAELLGQVLGDSPSGRLHKRLTERQLAARTYAYAWAQHDPSMLMAGAQLAPGQDVETARAEMLKVIESLATEPVTAEELNRARLQWLKAWDQAFADPETIGLSLSESVALGDWRFFFLARDHVRAIALADVQRVAQQYLVPANRTVGVYLPTDKPLRAPPPARIDVAQTLQSFKPQKAAAKVEAFEATPANIDARTQHSTVGGLKVALLPKGTRGAAVHAVLSLRFGDEKTLAGKGELASAVAALLDKGTPTLTRQQVQDRLDALQTDMQIGGGAGRVSVNLSSRREHLPAAIALVGDLLRNPVFPPEALDEYKRQALNGIERQRREPDAVAQNAVARHGNPYPRGDLRYARSFDEIVEDVNAVDLAKVRDFHRTFYGAARGEFSAVGDFDPAAVRAALQSALGDWKTGVPFVRVPRPLIEVPPTTLTLATPDKQNANLVVRLPVPLSDNDADYPALMMANYLLGGGGSSRLWRRIREADGLSYGVYSNVAWSQHEPNSDWGVTAIYAPQNRARIEAALREELARAGKDGFTAQELTEGKQGLLNFRRLGRAQDEGLAGALANNLYLDRTFAVSAKVDAALGALTLEQVNAALRKYIDPKRFVIAFAGDFKAAP
jgi:zinc protease